MLGTFLTKYLSANKKFNIIEADLPDYNIISYKSLNTIFRSRHIDYVINCAAYTDVTRAEEEKEKCFRVNCHGTGNLASLCKLYNSFLIHFSTDYVFNGKKIKPYLETDSTDPLNYYGYTKLRSEEIVKEKLKKSKNYIIFRLQWLYSENKGFFKWLANEVEKQKPVNIISQIGAPCSVSFISVTIEKCFKSTRYNLEPLKGEIYHLTHDNFNDRYEIAEYFFKRKKLVGLIEKLPVEQLIVPRPFMCVMSTFKLRQTLNIPTLDTWESDLKDFVC